MLTMTMLLFAALAAGVSAAGEWECAPPAFEYVQIECVDEGGEGTTVNTVEEAELIGRKFTLANVDGAAFVVSMGTRPFIEFGEGMLVSGNACNIFRGPGELTDGVLRVANAVSTRRMCIDPALAEFEKYFHKMLREGVVVALEGDTLTLTGGGGTLEYREEK